MDSQQNPVIEAISKKFASQYKGAKIEKIMRDFDISFSDALYIHIQSKKK